MTWTTRPHRSNWIVCGRDCMPSNLLNALQLQKTAVDPWRAIQSIMKYITSECGFWNQGVSNIRVLRHCTQQQRIFVVLATMAPSIQRQLTQVRDSILISDCLLCLPRVLAVSRMGRSVPRCLVAHCASLQQRLGFMLNMREIIACIGKVFIPIVPYASSCA